MRLLPATVRQRTNNTAKLFVALSGGKTKDSDERIPQIGPRQSPNQRNTNGSKKTIDSTWVRTKWMKAQTAAAAANPVK